jgi:hypothetical protein
MQKALERTDISFFKALILQIQWLVSQAQPFNLKVSIGFVLLYNNSLNFVPIKDSLYNCCFLILPGFMCYCQTIYSIQSNISILNFIPPEDFLKDLCILVIKYFWQIRRKDSQVTTELVLWIFILFKVTRWQHVSASITGHHQFTSKE